MSAWQGHAASICIFYSLAHAGKYAPRAVGQGKAECDPLTPRLLLLFHTL